MKYTTLLYLSVIGYAIAGGLALGCGNLFIAGMFFGAASCALGRM